MATVINTQVVEQIPPGYKLVTDFREFFTQIVVEKKDYKIGCQFIITSLRDPIIRYEVYTITKEWQEKDLGYRKLQKLLPFIQEGKCWLQTQAKEEVIENIKEEVKVVIPSYNKEDIDF